jgi:hypothetical protein
MVGNEVVAYSESHEPPNEDELRRVQAEIGADYYDICRSDSP